MAWLVDLEQAEELIRDIELPAEVERLLSEPRFWHEAVFLEVCRRCDHLIFTEPRKGFELSEWLPRLADRIPPEHCGIRTPGILKGRGFALYATGLRGLGRHDEAEVACVASGLLHRGAPLEDRVDFWLRLAHLRLNQRDLDAAREAVESALRVSRRIDAHEMGKALMWRGLVHWHSERFTEALQDYSVCLTHLDADRDEVGKRYYFAVTFNIGVALEFSGEDTAVVREALGHIQRARSLEHCVRHFEPGSLPVVKMVWAEARCQEKLGELVLAETGYREAREGVAALDIPFEYALISLDLAGTVFARGGFVEVAQIAADLWPVFQSLKLSRDDEAYAAAMLFYRSAQALKVTASIIEDARRKLRSHDLAQG